MNKRKALMIITVSLIVLALLSSCNGSSGGSGDNSPIKIGLVAPMSGGSSIMGVSQQNGYLLAIGEINDAGGINGREIELLTYDDTGDPQKAASGAQKFADDDSILAMGGSCNSTSTLAMVPIFDEAGIPDLVVSSSSNKLTGCSPYFFRMSVQDDMVGPQMAKSLLDMGKKSVVIFYPNNDYGIGLCGSLRDYFLQNGGTVLEELTYQADDQDFTAQVTTCKSLDPDAVAMCGTPADSGLIIKQLRQNGVESVLIGGTGLYNTNTVEIAGIASEGVYVIGVYVPTNPDPKVQELVSKYKNAYGSEPDNFAALAYDQMYVIAEACQRAMDNGELTRETLKDELKKTNYAGVTGTVTFNANNDWERDYLTLQIKDGLFVLAD